MPVKPAEQLVMQTPPTTVPLQLAGKAWLFAGALGNVPKHADRQTTAYRQTDDLQAQHREMTNRLCTSHNTRMGKVHCRHHVSCLVGLGAGKHKAAVLVVLTCVQDFQGH